MGLHTEFLVRVFTHRAVHLVGPRLQRQRQGVPRARLDSLDLLFDPLSFDLEAVRDAAGVRDRERHGPRPDARLRQLHFPLGQLGAHMRRGVGMRSRRRSYQSAEQRNGDDGPTPNLSRLAVHSDLPRQRVRHESIHPEDLRAGVSIPEGVATSDGRVEQRSKQEDEDAAKMEVGHRGAHGGRPAIEVRPKREQMRYAPQYDHGHFPPWCADGKTDQVGPIESVADRTLAAVFAARYFEAPCPMCSNVSGRPSPSTTPSSARSVPAAWRPYISHGISSTIAPSP